MTQILCVPSWIHGFQMFLVAGFILVTQPPTSLAQEEITKVEEHLNPALQPLTAAEIDQAIAAFEGDQRSRERVTRNQRIQTILVERHEEGKDTLQDQRRADVVRYNYDTNETISAIV